MNRGLPAALANALANADTIAPILLFEAEFVGGWLRLWTGVGDLIWNGYTWTGVGSVVNVSPIEEAGEVRAAGVAVGLQPLDPAITSIVLQSVRQNQIGRVYLGLLNADNEAVGDSDTLDELGDPDTGDEVGTAEGGLLDTPFLAFEGRLDISEISENAAGATVSIWYELRLVDLERPRSSRWTDEDQKARYSNDLGFQFVGPLADKQITWGATG